MNVHTPERGADESREDYKARRRLSAEWSPIVFSYPPGQRHEPRRAQRRALKRLHGNRQWRRAVLKAYKLKAARQASEASPLERAR